MLDVSLMPSKSSLLPRCGKGGGGVMYAVWGGGGVVYVLWGEEGCL